jgi:transposase
VVDAVGRPVCLALTEGQRNEITIAPCLLSGIRHAYVVGDRAYDARALREQLQAQHCRAVIPPNPTRRSPARYSKRLYRRRHLVENFFQRLKRFRRVATRYEKLAATFFAMVCFAAVFAWL